MSTDSKIEDANNKVAEAAKNAGELPLADRVHLLGPQG